MIKNIYDDRSHKSFSSFNDGAHINLNLPSLGNVPLVDETMDIPTNLYGVYHNSGSGISAIFIWDKVTEADGYDLQFRGRQGGSGTWDDWSSASGFSVDTGSVNFLRVGGGEILSRNPIQIRVRAKDSKITSDWSEAFQMHSGSGNANVLL